MIKNFYFFMTVDNMLSRGDRKSDKGNFFVYPANIIKIT